jgi:hypothetical protein
MKGESCHFLHSLAERQRMPECATFTKWGRCVDADCEYRHDLYKAECVRYKLGYCKLGKTCKLRHEKLPRQQAPDIVPDWYLKELCSNVFDLIPRLPEHMLRGDEHWGKGKGQRQQPPQPQSVVPATNEALMAILAQAQAAVAPPSVVQSVLDLDDPDWSYEAVRSQVPLNLVEAQPSAPQWQPVDDAGW